MEELEPARNVAGLQKHKAKIKLEELQAGTRQVCRNRKQKKGGRTRARNAAGSRNSDKKKSDRRGEALQRETSPRPSLEEQKQASPDRSDDLSS